MSTLVRPEVEVHESYNAGRPHGRPVVVMTRPHWSLLYAAIAVVVVVVATLGTSVVVGSLDSDFLLIMSGIVWVILFVASFTLLGAAMPGWSETRQMLVLFSVALLVRLAAVALTYFEFRAWNGSAFEPYGSDSVYYHDAAVTLAQQLSSGGLPGVLSYTTPSNLGYIVFVGLVYAVWGVDVIAVRVIQAMAGALTAVLVYKTLRLAVGPAPARTGGLLVALSPYLIYYTGLHLKETVLNLIIAAIIYLAVLVSAERGKRGVSVAGLAVALSSVFFFRTFLAVLLVGGVCVHVLIQHRAYVAHRTRAVVIVGVAAITAVVVGVAQPRLWSEVVGMVGMTAGQWERELRDKEQNMGTSIDTDLASQGVFVMVAAVGPLPAVVSIPGQENSLIQYGFAWVRHVFMFFALVGLYVAFRQRLRTTAVLLVFLAGYILIIGAAGLPTSHRFQLPTLPAWSMLAAIGMHAPLPRGRVLAVWLLSMLLIACVVVTWNYMKLSVRGF